MSDIGIDSLEQIEAKISSLADTFLTSGQPYLLSKLGKDLGEDLRRLKTLTGKPLAEFLTERFSDRFSVVFAGTHGNIQALVRSPRGDAPAESFSGQSKAKNEGPRYNYRFWAAFSVPDRGQRRFLNLTDFTFVEGPEVPGLEYVEVEQEFIAADDIPDRDARIRENIQRWLSEKKLPAEKFLAKPAPVAERGVSYSANRSVLEAMIDALDRRQLTNTTLSLDVVADLLRRRF